MSKKVSSVKTNAARILDTAGIHYQLCEYTVDEEDLSAPSVAAKIGMPPEQVFKTLVARGDRSGVLDRKSTRLNSSHLGISYAVFCLKKKNKMTSTHKNRRINELKPRIIIIAPVL